MYWNYYSRDGILQGNAAFFVASWYNLPEPDERTFNYTTVPFPRGPDNDAHVSIPQTLMWGYAIPHGTPSPEDVFMFWEAWHDLDYTVVGDIRFDYIAQRFMRYEDFSRVIRDAHANHAKFDLGPALADGNGSIVTDLLFTLGQGLLLGTSTPFDLAEAQRVPTQQRLDRLFDEVRQ